MTDHLSTLMLDRPAVTIAKLKLARGAGWCTRTYDDPEMHRMLNTERDGIRKMLERVAVHRETDPDAASDPRCAEATRIIRHLAATMADVPDDLLLDIAATNRMTGGLLSALIAARLCGIGFELEPYASATALYCGFIELAEEAAAGVKRKRLNRSRGNS